MTKRDLAEIENAEEMLDEIIRRNALDGCWVVRALLRELLEPDAFQILRIPLVDGGFPEARKIARRLRECFDTLEEIRNKIHIRSRDEALGRFHLWMIDGAAARVKDLAKATDYIPVISQEAREFAANYEKATNIDARTINKSDPRERVLVGLIYLVFRYARGKPSRAPHDAPPTQFEEACYAIMRRRNHVNRPASSKPEMLTSDFEYAFYERLRRLLEAQDFKDVLYKVVSLFDRCRLRHEKVSRILLNFWMDCLIGVCSLEDMPPKT